MNRLFFKRRRFLVMVALVIMASYALVAGSVPEMNRPQSGPGSASYVCQDVKELTFGEGVTAYHIFAPANPTPATAPVILFNHGWGAMRPAPYAAWITHLVRRGAVVIYPQYQDSLRTPPKTFTDNAITAEKDAIARLQHETGIAPDLEKFAIVGHSMGGLITANTAARAAKAGLPVPKAVMSVEPGKSWGRIGALPLDDLRTIPSSTLLLTIAGDADRVVGDQDAQNIIKGTPQISWQNKNYIVVNSDRWHDQQLDADHSAPTASVLNAYDYYGYWKLFDALTDAAFFGTHREYALGNTPQQRSLGSWPDGTPVKPLTVIDHQ